MRILVSGHWRHSPLHRRGGALHVPAHLALEQVARGFSGLVEVETLPFGTGEDTAAALACVGGPRVLDVPLDGDGLVCGRALREALLRGEDVLVEAGHSTGVDAGMSFLAGLAGLDDLSWEGRWRELLGPALERAREVVGARLLTMTTSTARPLSGLGSAFALAPDLSVRDQVDPRDLHDLSRLLRPGLGALPVSGRGGIESDVTRLAGSGAGGGAGAVVAALGGRLVPTGEFLAGALDLRARLEGIDLLVVLEADLHSPVLAESPVTALTEAATGLAVPVVAVSSSSSLSSHEAAQWGIHGVIVCEESDRGPAGAGERIARTWLRGR